MRARPLLLALSALVTLSGCPLDEDVTALEVALRVAPAELSLDPLYAGEPKALVLRIENDGAAATRLVEAIYVASEGEGAVQVSPLGDRVAGHAALDVRVRVLAPVGASGLMVGRVVLRFESAPTVEVPLVAVVRPIPPCDDDNPCTLDRFVEGECRHEVVVDGSPCDDENACTTATLCLDGRCLGEAVRCADDIGCTLDTCDPDTGCVFVPQDGQCDDEDPCTDDVCAMSGCENPPKPVGSLCALNGCESIGFCVLGTCELHDVPDGIPCTDGELCTIGDACHDGACVPGPAAAVGPEEPRVVVPGVVATDVYLGLYDGAWQSFLLLPDAVLAAHRRIDGVTQVVWRTGYVTEYGTPCDPLAASSLDLPIPTPSAPVPIADPDDEQGGAGAAEDPQPPPPLPSVCAAGVFLTEATEDGIATVQLVAADGPAAASLVDTAQALPQVAVAVASVPNGGVRVRLFDGYGNINDDRWLWSGSLLGQPFLPPVVAPITALAVAHTTTSVAVVAAPATREAPCLLDCDLDTDGPGCCSTNGLLTWRYPTTLNAEAAAEWLLVEEWPDDRCLNDLYAPPYPLRVDDLAVAIDGSGLEDEVVLTFRLDPRGCADVPYALRLPEVFQSRVGFTQTLALSPTPPLPPTGGGTVLGVRSLVLAPDHRSGAAIADVDQCDPNAYTVEPCDAEGCGVCAGCGCQGRVVDLVTLDGAITTTDRLLLDVYAEPPWEIEALPIAIEDGARVALRTGTQLELIGRDDETGEVTRALAPALPADLVWGPGLKGARDVVAGRVFSTVRVDTPEDEALQIAIQGFSCSAEPASAPVLCLDDSACGGDEYCDFEGGCSYPSCCDDALDCDVDCDPPCHGVCRARPPDPVDPCASVVCPEGMRCEAHDPCEDVEGPSICGPPLAFCLPNDVDAGLPDDAGADAGVDPDGGASHDDAGADGGSVVIDAGAGGADGGVSDGGASDGGPDGGATDAG